MNGLYSIDFIRGRSPVVQPPHWERQPALKRGNAQVEVRMQMGMTMSQKVALQSTENVWHRVHKMTLIFYINTRELLHLIVVSSK